ncbi:HU family DNA-binding protein [Reichenbachiella agariperforans]|uniref:DNA-binding protein, histone-like, putative n=2 Tax=Reichenbachiella agariperforans TaxID=156994 RepID=A0A1M6SM82_REIAG|nr:HU family DNA-binding protein [Reichenbachiella agariperforans]MBU2916190.1 hypothetical protein [Reichenbachiella agariperforans]SHK45823.1 DNA-binding protein, histone-like, putative [Reichenbachiella agariperforans]
MSIMYKAVPKAQPGVVGGGQIKYYASIIRERPVGIRKIATEISKMTSLHTTDIFGVLESFLDRMHTYLEEGRIVRLGDMGSFSPAIASYGEDLIEDVDKRTIKRLKVNFRPSMELNDRLSTVKFVKQDVEPIV